MNKTLKNAMPYLFISFAGGLLYLHVYSFKYTYLDDASIIMDAAKSMMADPFSIFHTFAKNMFYTSQPQIYYRPIFDASFMLNSVFSQNHLGAYYFINIILHMAASCLVFRLLIRLGNKITPSFLLALFFTVSPMAAQTVAWLPGRSDTMVAIFCILSFLAFINFLDTVKFRHWFLHMFFLLLALFSKESALCLVIMCFLYTRLILKRKPFFTGEIFLLVGWFVILSGYFLLRHAAFNDPLKLTAGEMLHYIAANSLVIVHYIGRILFPINLSVWPTLQDSPWITGLIAIIILLFLMLRSKKIQFNYALFGFLWFIVFLLPALIRPNTGVSAVFLNTRAYLPMAGLLILLAQTDMIKNVDIKKWRHIVVASIILIFYAFIAFEHSYDFANSSVFWTNAKITAPHSWIDPADVKN